jgi:lipid-A-disaccharide synthase-like uncharacterized protein
MSDWIVYTIGFTAQALFSGRLLIQWIVSERSRQIVTPGIFWKLSLLASFLLFVYGYLRDDLAIMLGQTLTYFIYIRNLHLKGDWQRSPFWFRAFLLVFPIAIVTYGYNNGEYDIYQLLNNEDIPLWLLWLGIIAQVIFTFRFVYQWLYSEREKESQLPMGFWVLSVLGASLILLYAVFRRDPVLLIGHGAGTIIYVRNIMLGLKHSHAQGR